MKKTILATVVAATLSISSVSFAGDIETAERYSAPLEQNVVSMDVSAVKTGQEIASSELASELELVSLGSHAEIQELGGGKVSLFWGMIVVEWD